MGHGVINRVLCGTGHGGGRKFRARGRGVRNSSIHRHIKRNWTTFVD